MKYLAIRPCQKVKHPIQIDNFHAMTRIRFTTAEIDQINRVTTLYVRGSPDSIFLDIYTWPLYLVSEKVKEVIEAYEHRVIFKPVILANIEHRIQKRYHLMMVDQIDAIAKETTYRLDKITKLVIDESKTEGRGIFEISTSKDHYLIVKLNVMESMLRRDVQGLDWEEIEST
ncbi:MAG: hypothetical protein FWG67_00350 [Defluviitaleaceae bacterium]|nr:hypothetical protein [Defluviitaleaceae bacterium]